jgi:hypothetical protein
MVRRMLVEGPFVALAKATNAPGGELRAMLVGSHIMGVALLRYILRVEPMASAPPEELVRLLSPAIQRYLTGDIDAGSGQGGHPA